MARFSIFGASGFIGSHLAKSVHAAGHEITGFDRNDRPPAGASLGHAVYCIGLTADFRMQLAATVRAHVCVLADLLDGYSFESFLYLSSTRVYAGATDTREEATLSVRSDMADQIYNLSKLTGEALCLAHPEATVRVARISNVVGHGAAAENFLPSLLQEARQLGEVTVHTSAGSAKDYIDVRDLCWLLERIALNGRARIYNVAAGVNVNNETIASLIAQATGAKVTFATDAQSFTFPLIDTSRIIDEFSFSAIPFAKSFEYLVNEPHAKVD